MQRAARPRSAQSDEHSGDLLRLLHRRLDAVEAELVGRLLGVVDDVVERAGERVHVGGVERAARPVPRERCIDVVRDPVAVVLAAHDVARERRLLGVVGEQVAQQARGALDVLRGVLEEAEQPGSGVALARAACRRHLDRARAQRRRSFTTLFTAGFTRR